MQSQDIGRLIHDNVILQVFLDSIITLYLFLCGKLYVNIIYFLCFQGALYMQLYLIYTQFYTFCVVVVIFWTSKLWNNWRNLERKQTDMSAIYYSRLMDTSAYEVINHFQNLAIFLFHVHYFYEICVSQFQDNNKKWQEQ